MQKKPKNKTKSDDTPEVRETRAQAKSKLEAENKQKHVKTNSNPKATKDAPVAIRPKTRLQTNKEEAVEKTTKALVLTTTTAAVPAPAPKKDTKGKKLSYKPEEKAKAKPAPKIKKPKHAPVVAANTNTLPCVRIADVFQVGPKLGSGAFGDVFSGHDIRTGAEVAIKMESLHAECPQLLYESRVMQELQAAPGFPRHYWFGREGNYNVLVMQRLGRCLASRYMPVELGVVQAVARDALARLQTLHAAGFAYRDIKPENFVYGVGAAKTVLYIIDFGLCKRVAEPRTGRHIPHRLGKSLSGTPRYASARMHDGEEQSRRDDIEALGYMLVYLVKGVLPWQGLPAKNDYRDAGNLKKKMKVEALCEGLPPAFAATIAYARGLDFFAMPDYIYLRSLWT